MLPHAPVGQPGPDGSHPAALLRCQHAHLARSSTRPPLCADCEAAPGSALAATSLTISSQEKSALTSSRLLLGATRRSDAHRVCSQAVPKRAAVAESAGGSATAHSGPPDRGLRILVRRRLTNQPATDACCAGTACQRMIGRQRSHQNAPPLTPARATPIPAHHAVPTTAPMSAITRHTVPTPANSPRLCGHLGPRPSSTPRRRTPRRKKGAPIERIARTPNASRNPTPAHDANPNLGDGHSPRP